MGYVEFIVSSGAAEAAKQGLQFAGERPGPQTGLEAQALPGRRIGDRRGYQREQQQQYARHANGQRLASADHAEREADHGA